MATATRRAPRTVRNGSDNPLRATPIVDDEPPDFVAPKSSEDFSEAKQAIKEETEKEYRPGKYHDPVMKIYGGMAIGLLPFLPETAAVMARSADECAKQWELMARRNPSVRRLLDVLTENSGRFALAGAHMSILVSAARETGVAEKVMKTNAVKRFMSRFMPKPKEETWQDVMSQPPNGYAV